MTHEDTPAAAPVTPAAAAGTEEYITINQALERSGLSRSTLEKLITDGKLTVYRREATPKERRVRTEQLDELTEFRPATS